MKELIGKANKTYKNFLIKSCRKDIKNTFPSLPPNQKCLGAGSVFYPRMC